MSQKFQFEKLIKYLNEEWLQKAIIETHRQADIIGFLSLIALVLAIIFIFLLRYIAKIMIGIIILLSTLGSIGTFSSEI